MPGRSGRSLVLSLVEHDLDRQALHHLDEVAARVLGRQQAEARGGGGADRLHVPLEVASGVGVHLDRRALAGAHRPHLRLLEVRHHPHVVERHHRHHRLPRAHELAHLDALARHHARHRRAHLGVLQVELGAAQLGGGLLHSSRCRGGLGFGDGDALRRGAGGGGLGLAPSHLGAGLDEPALGHRHLVAGHGHRGLRRIDRRRSRVLVLDRAVVLLLRDLVALDQRRQALLVARRPRVLGFGLTQPRFGAAQAGLGAGQRLLRQARLRRGRRRRWRERRRARSRWWSRSPARRSTPRARARSPRRDRPAADRAPPRSRGGRARTAPHPPPPPGGP